MPSDTPTNPPPAGPQSALDIQAELTASLLQHPDPHVRLIAHVSERQLGLFNMIEDDRRRRNTDKATMREGLRELVLEIQSLREDLKLPPRRASAPLLRLLNGASDGTEEAAEAASV